MRVGLIGYPLAHSISPVFQQAAFDEVGLPIRYELWEVTADRLPDVADQLRAPECLGANVTIPYKQAMLSFLDEVDPSVQIVGAVNTIIRDGRQLIGYNTDVAGFIRSVREDGGVTLPGRRVVVLGAGGAARAVVAACLFEGTADVVVCSRRLEQGISLTTELAAAWADSGVTTMQALELRPTDAVADVIHRADIVVNATPIGMAHRSDGAEPPVPVDALSSRHLVCDLIYNPPRTRLLQSAAERGARTLNGLPMLVYQGATAFEIWTKRAAPIELMRRKAQEALHV